MKRLQKYSIFLFVAVCCFFMIGFKNQFQKDYTELSVKQIEQKIKDKESFVLTFTNIPASSEQTYLEAMMYLISEANQDVITMNKFNKDYISKNRKVIYYNTDIFSKEKEIKKIFNDLFKKVEINDINFDKVPVTIWIQNGEIFYAGIGQTSKAAHTLLTDKVLNNSKDEIDLSSIKFEVTEKEEEKDKDKESDSKEDSKDKEDKKDKDDKDNSSDKKEETENKDKEDKKDSGKKEDTSKKDSKK